MVFKGIQISEQCPHCLKTSCAISGTGFLVKRDLIEKYKGWNFFLLTEDLEFTIDNIINMEKIGYCSEAIFYDEQPITFKQSWNQRLRWAKGFYQVLRKYGFSLIKGIFSKQNFACFDMFMYVFPASLLSSLIFLFYITKLVILFFLKDTSILLNDLITPILLNFLYLYLFLYILGIITTITEWKKIICEPGKKILYSFTFPFFMLTYIPIPITALLKNVTWKPIQHTVSRSVEKVEGFNYSE